MNSLNSELIGELDSAIDAIVANNEISVVIIKGGEKFFAAGADIKEIDDISGHCRIPLSSCPGPT